MSFYPMIDDAFFKDLHLIKYKSAKVLQNYGMMEFGNNSDNTLKLFLFPKDWYDKIPEGFEITYIHWGEGTFHKGVTDDDTRFGMLAYGITIPVE